MLTDYSSHSQLSRKILKYFKTRIILVYQVALNYHDGAKLLTK